MITQTLAPIDATNSAGRCWNDVVKRAFDIAGATFGLIVLSPILAGIALAIKITDPGPIFYRGIRTGRYGKPFRIYKFRSMVVNAEQCGGTTTGQSDSRITRVGSFLRKYKFDELPQLINVLVGDMSFVGPRPEVAEYTNQYNQEEQRILSVRPGITDYSSIEFHDLQQVVGHEAPDETYRNRVLPRKMELRLRYAREQSFLGDMKILLLTFWVLFARSIKKVNE
jgi:lipopolysaccharide/colanic/teichoic acid biosynthesis glycosyltransferase